MLKIIVAGSGGIGKTSILNRWCNGCFDECEVLTKGADFFVKRLEIDGKFVNIQLWDFAGQERFRFLLQEFVKGSVGAILAFDVERGSSFFDLEGWLQLLRGEIPDLPIVLMATKRDQKYHPTINPDMANDFAQKNNLIDFVETSARDGYNVEAAFLSLINYLQREE